MKLSFPIGRILVSLLSLSIATWAAPAVALPGDTTDEITDWLKARNIDLVYRKGAPWPSWGSGANEKTVIGAIQPGKFFGYRTRSDEIVKAEVYGFEFNLATVKGDLKKAEAKWFADFTEFYGPDVAKDLSAASKIDEKVSVVKGDVRRKLGKYRQTKEVLFAGDLYTYQVVRKTPFNEEECTDMLPTGQVSYRVYIYKDTEFRKGIKALSSDIAPWWE